MNIHTVEGICFAKKLDNELRQKYPTINLMLDVANSLPKTIENGHAIVREKMIPELESLQQDRCGIICDVLLKKSAVSSLERCIDRVTE